ncbi:MAG: sugar phosphate nucleotidyltransferase [Christensenellales bacterium]
MKAVIMAGGSGTRLRPLTCTIPKPMVPVLNRPVMEYTIELLSRHGIKDIAVTLQYLPDEIMNYFKDGANWDVRLSYFIETKPLGTAGSVKNARAFLDEPFIVISGDALTDLDVTAAVSWHNDKKSRATLVTKNVAIPLEFGVVISDSESRITRFLEKPGWGEVFSDRANTGIYLFDLSVFDYIGDGPVDFSRDVFPKMLASGVEIYALSMDGYWCDIGDISQYMQANFDLLDGKCNLPIKAQNINGVFYDGLPDAREKPLHIEPPILIGANAKLDPACSLKKYAVIGKGCWIGAAQIERSILWDYVSVGDGTEVSGAVLCSGSQIEQQSRLLEESVVGKESVVGERSTISSGIRIWPQKIVEACSCQSENVVWGNVRKKVVFSEGAVAGKVPLDISPQLAAWIGQIFAFQKKSLVIGCDGKAVSDMVTKGILSGLLSQDCNALDLDYCTPAALRHAVVTLEQDGGIFVRDLGGNTCKIQLYDEHGLTLSRKAEKSLEERYQQQEIFKGRSGSVITKRNMMSLYFNDLLRSITSREIESRPYRVVLGRLPNKLKRPVSSFFAQLGCSVFHAAQSVEQTIRDFHGDAGFLFGELLEEIEIYDEDGSRIHHPELLPSYLETLFTNIQHVPVPAAFPPSAQQFIQKAGRSPVQCKNGADYALKTALDYNEIETKDARFLYSVHFDALCAAAMFLKAMTATGSFASEIMDALGTCVRRSADIDCRDRDIGKVMRILSEEGWRPTAEGVSYENEQGSVNVYPSKRGRLRVSAGSYDSEFAEELLSVYSNQVHHMVDQLKE